MIIITLNIDLEGLKGIRILFKIMTFWDVTS
jgi:hypothetical protein